MKLSAFMLLVLLNASGLPAATPVVESVEFEFAPSFEDGTLVFLARAADGKIVGSIYALPIVDDGGVARHAKARAKLIREVTVTARDFDSIVSIIESEGLRTEAESMAPVGVDGTGWTFRRKAGGRLLELRFWTPEDSPASRAFNLGWKFALTTHLDGVLPGQPPNQPPQPTRPTGG